MRLYVLLLFLTLVVSGLAAIAAPVVDHQPDPILLSPQSKEEPIYASERTEKTWSARVGYLNGAISEARQSEQIIIYGVRYDFNKESLSTWQIEAMTGKDNFLHFVLGKKFYFPLETVTLPYYKLSVGNMIDSTEGIGSVFNLKKIQAMTAVGLDDLFQWDQRLQVELVGSYALVGFQLEMSLGFAF